MRILKLVDKKPDIRNLAIHLCFQTGVRVGELAALKWEDIDWENGTLHIQRIETRAFTQDTSTAKKKSYINNQKVIINLISSKKLSEKNRLNRQLIIR
ncbi:hypothetical protein DWV67_02125 [Dorea formicigenerans]|uniref:Tyr recombinase domain-containing protein n=1 Tax=Dorea formicigenerans TaxID=39486 RepID=A0A395XSY1_9FIRM|nr:hypothetical protein DWV67_02125 [Dorea formicigenerans]